MAVINITSYSEKFPRTGKYNNSIHISVPALFDIP